ncbi:MAG: hypothetical protein C5B50_17185 [Verrucomicrobia bacterium]|nr:MAG: hypothetical protein C5B50_17185 [Verrucomicrobiota bacterium]
MRTQILLSFLLVVAALAADTNAFRAYERIDLFTFDMKPKTNAAGKAVVCPCPLLGPSGAAIFTNGISLGQIVKKLGPGWMSPAARATTIHWSFTDGREVTVSPPSQSSGGKWEASFVLGARDTPSQCHFYWTTNLTYCFTNAAARK